MTEISIESSHQKKKIATIDLKKVSFISLGIKHKCEENNFELGMQNPQQA